MAEAQNTPRKLEVNVDTFTLGELADLEDIAGADAFHSLLRGEVGGKAITALAWITERRSNPDLTLEEVRTWRFVDVVLDVGNRSPNPTSSAG